jgi:hypothetical protein
MKTSILPAILLTLFLASCVTREMTGEDKRLLLSAEEVEEFGFDFPDTGQLGKYTLEVYFDKAKDLEYEFETAAGDEDYLYIYNSISLETSSGDANLSYNAQKLGFKIGFDEGVSFIELDSLFQFGEKSSVRLVKNGQNKIGNIFHFKKGKLAYVLIMYGLYFEEKEPIEMILLPKLTRIDSLANH